MIISEDPGQPEFDPGSSVRITRVGWVLRKTKLDELPELFNVLNGEMSIVGPRPEVKRYVSFYSEDFRKILKIRPGLSDYASIKYRDEEGILAGQSDPEYYYVHVILPDKLRLARRYIKDISFGADLRIVRDTLGSIVALGINRFRH
jgi:lipopolysaccharide/colanic/teichoic acid biosynthesis glycosyltransferase